MPPRDPRLCPALEVARPDDFTGVRREPVPFPEPWLMEFGSGEWREVSVTSRWFRTDGREIVQVDWVADDWHGSETYWASRDQMRPRW